MPTPVPNAANGYVANPIFTALIPDEGPRAISQVIPFSSAVDTVYTVDMTLPIKEGLIRLIQTLWVDNADNTDALTIRVSGSRQRLIVPGGQMGMLPVICQQEPIFSFESDATSDVFVQFLNVPVPYLIWATQ